MANFHENVSNPLTAMNDMIERLETGLASQELVQRPRAELALFTFHRLS